MGKKDPSARARANRRGGKHPIYIGVRKRKWGMWVSETREPMKQKSIWLGSIPTPEMAARAHDTAALALRGKCANFNFPESIHFLPHPTSSSTTNIQAPTVQGSDNKSEVVESWLDWPSLLMNTADGMAIGSSLLCHSQFIEEEEQDHQYISLWDFTFDDLLSRRAID